jgi:hypothetical protein
LMTTLRLSFIGDDCSSATSVLSTWLSSAVGTLYSWMLGWKLFPSVKSRSSSPIVEI